MPKQGRLSILIDKFLRVNEDASIEELVKGEIPLMNDMVLNNPFGKPHIRGGFEETSLTANAKRMGMIIDVKSKNGTNYLLGGTGENIDRNSGTTWTTIKTGLDNSLVGYFRHVAYGDDIIITNLLDKPFRIAGNDLTVTTDLEIEKPDLSQVSINSVNSDVGELSAGSAGYYYMMVYVTEVGERSNPSLALSCRLTTGGHTGSISDKQKYLSNLPIPTDDRIKSKWLYRTESWDGISTTDGRTFYLRAKLDIETTTLIDGLADIELDFSESVKFSRVPEKAQHITQSNNRVWFGNVAIHQKTFFEPIIIPLPASSIVVGGLTYSSAILENLTAGLAGTTTYDLTSLVAVGDMASDTEWDKGDGWTIPTPVAHCDGTQSADSDLSQVIENKLADPNGIPYRLVEGREYDISFDILNWSAGNATLVLGGTEGTDRGANGTHTETIIAGADGKVAIRADVNFIGDVDNVLIGAGGLVAEEWHQYILTYIDINGYESEPNYGSVFQIGAGSLEEAVIRDVGIAEVGANGYSNNPDIKFRRLYRTEGQVSLFTANTLPFKLVVEEDIRHDEPLVYLSGDALQHKIFDDLSDARLGATYAEVIREAKSSVMWSQVDRPSYMLAENIKSIFKDDQDEISGIVDDGNGVLIFKENAIVKLYHTGAPENWYLRKVWSEFGCDEPKSLMKAGDIIYFRYRNRPYAFRSGSAPVYMGFGKQKFLDTITMNDIAVTDEWIIWLGKDSSELDYLAVYDKIAKSWYQFNLNADPTGYIIRTIFAKRYDGVLTKGKFYVANDEVYEYDKASALDDISGSPVSVTGEIQLPRVKLDILTKSKLRDIVASISRIGSETINISVQTEDVLSTGTVPTGEGVIRITGHGGLLNSSYFDVTLDGGIEQLDAIRFDVRPQRKGVGSI